MNGSAASVRRWPCARSTAPRQAESSCDHEPLLEKLQLELESLSSSLYTLGYSTVPSALWFVVALAQLHATGCRSEAACESAIAAVGGIPLKSTAYTCISKGCHCTHE